MAKNFDKEKVITMLSNIIFSSATLFGVLTVVLAFLIMSIGTSVFALTSKITGMFGGPVAAVFFCGLILPKLSSAVSRSFIINHCYKGPCPLG